MKKDLSPVYDLIRADGSLVINKNLSHAIGINESIIYGELLSRYNYFNIREELDEDGFFFNTVDDLQLGTCLGEKPQKTAIKALVILGLIDYKLKGAPPKRYFRINNDINVLLFLLTKGKEKATQMQEKQTERIDKSKLRLLGEIESAQQEELNQPNGCVNNTKLNNTNPNNTKLIAWDETSDIREGTPKGDTKSLSYHSFLLQDIKKYDTKYKSEIVEFIIYYNSLYLECTGEEHKRYKQVTLKEIYSRLDTIFSLGIQDERYNRMQNDIELDTLKELAEKHFNTKYSKKISWTLLTFLNDKIMVNRYYELYGAM